MTKTQHKEFHIPLSRMTWIPGGFAALGSLTFFFLSVVFTYDCIIEHAATPSVLTIIAGFILATFLGIGAASIFIKRSDFIHISENGIDINKHHDLFWRNPTIRHIDWNEIYSITFIKKCPPRSVMPLDHIVIRPQKVGTESYTICLGWMKTDIQTLRKFIDKYHKTQSR